MGPLAVVREMGSLDLKILVARFTVLESLPTMSWSVPVLLHAYSTWHRSYASTRAPVRR